MNVFRPLRILVAAALMATAFAAPAAGDLDYPIELRTAMAKMAGTMDKNKDGMVTRKEFIEMQGRMFDMARKKNQGRMTMEEFDHFMAEFGRSFGR